MSRRAAEKSDIAVDAQAYRSSVSTLLRRQAGVYKFCTSYGELFMRYDENSDSGIIRGLAIHERMKEMEQAVPRPTPSAKSSNRSNSASTGSIGAVRVGRSGLVSAESRGQFSSDSVFTGFFAIIAAVGLWLGAAIASGPRHTGEPIVLVIGTIVSLAIIVRWKHNIVHAIQFTVALAVAFLVIGVPIMISLNEQ